MKKLGKLTISPEKIMKNEELINLQGGYDGGGTPPCDSQLWLCYCTDNGENMYVCSPTMPGGDCSGCVPA
jgi:hypothetical protein